MSDDKPAGLTQKERELEGPDAAPSTATVKTPRCVGCLGIGHGSVNLGRLCLEQAVVALRAEVARLREEKK